MNDLGGRDGLRGRVVLVTGAASGIGRETARSLAKLGARLVIADVNEVALREIESELTKATEVLLARVVDVSKREDMRAFAAEVHDRVEAVDVLINNAGVGLSGGILDTTLDDWDWVLSINLGGVIHGCHFFVPQMVKRGAGGHVVNVSSVLGLFGAPNVLGYTTSKFAVVGLSESLRAELAPHKIVVSAICPGIIATGIIASSRFKGVRDEGATRDKVNQMYKRRNYGPEKVADAIVEAVRRGTAVVPVSPEAWALYLLKRFAPSLGGSLGRVITKRAVE